jgi:aryl-alcohol dehydrogenase-like predicted oxidoreductase
MKYNYIGKSGLRVSRLCLGTMTFGFSADKEEAFRIMDAAWENGINFFDTAEVYPVPPHAKYAGDTEIIVGEWLKERGIPRDALILATKVAGAANGWFVPPIRHGLTAIDRFHLERAVEGSLKRLGTDYIDLYQMHWPDTVVPIEESMAAFDRLVQSGKVRYVGTSNDTAYGLTKALGVSKYEKLTRFESIQNNFSLLNRRFLDELGAVCEKEKLSLLAYSPLAGGVLSGKYQDGLPKDARYGVYAAMDDARMNAQAARFAGSRSIELTAKYLQIAKEAGINPVTMAMAWTLSFSFLGSSIFGVTKKEQLKEILDSADMQLGVDIMKALDAAHSKVLYPMG